MIFYNNNKYYCECGNMMEDYFISICDKCGCDEKIEMSDNRKYHTFEIIKNTYEGFKIKKEIFFIKISDNKLSLIKEEEYMTEFNIKNEVVVYKDGRKVAKSNYKKALSNCNFSEREFLIKDYLCLITSCNGKYSLSTIIEESLKTNMYELCYKSGFTTLNNLNKSYINIKGKNLKEIFNLPKSIINKLKQDTLYLKYFKQIQSMNDNLGTNITLYFMENCKDILYSGGDIIRLIKNYNYDWKNLINYLYEEIQVNQGILNPRDGFILLLDYIEMCQYINRKFQKYPKSLKLVHDIETMNYKVQRDKNITENFLNNVNNDDYKQLEYIGSEYSVIIPDNPKDLTKEGNSLSHCVATYITRIAKGSTKVYFIRDNRDLNKPFYTLEIRDNQITQCKGKMNCNPDKDVVNFLKEYSESKRLDYVA